MAMFNSRQGYGRLTKALHWLIALLFALQYAGGHIMQRLPAKESFLGATQGDVYNWHKSLGLVALAFALLRLWNRRQGALPPWAKSLSAGERRFIHHAERGLYAGMLVMPLSGFAFVMAGGYGVLLFGRWSLPNPIGKNAFIASLAEWTHILSGWLIAVALIGHIGLVLRHQLMLRDGLLKRML